MAIKRKAVVKAPKTALGRSLKAAKKMEDQEAEVDVEADQDVEEETEEVQAIEAEEHEEEAEEEEEEESEEDRVAREEEETTVARKKELKATSVDDLKTIASNKGLDIGNKLVMVEMILTHEAQERANIREQKAQVRQVLVAKKEALEALGMPELRDACVSFGITGQLTKQARVEMVIKRWQEDDGVDKALSQIAYDKRRAGLELMPNSDLRSLCETVGINPFVKELVVERVVRAENKAGHFARPSSELKMVPEDEAPKTAKKTDMVDALLANEVQRKKEKEIKKQEEELAENRRKELRAMSVDELKKQLTTKGLDAAGKKDELIEAVFNLRSREEAVLAKKADMKAYGLEKLRAILKLNQIDAGKSQINDVVNLLLEHEEKVHENARLYEGKVVELLAKQKEELESKSAAELKEMCTAKGLKSGVGKDVHVERLLEEAKLSGLADVEKVLAMHARNARKEELSAMDTPALLHLADKMSIDTLMKEVMVERVLAHEADVGPIVVASGPATKKLRRA